MLRIIVRITDIAAAANIGGPVDITYKTFDVNLAEIETYIARKHQYSYREVVGVEVIVAREEGESDG